MTEQNNIAQHPALTDEDKRRQLREKIEAGQRRNAQRTMGDYARDAAQTATDFVKKHPVATIAGGVTLGLVIGAMTRPGRRVRRRSGALAALVLDTAMAYGLKALDGANGFARSAGDRFDDLGHAVESQTRDLRREAAHRAEATSEALLSAGRKASRKSGRALRDLRSRFTG